MLSLSLLLGEAGVITGTLYTSSSVRLKTSYTSYIRGVRTVLLYTFWKSIRTPNVNATVQVLFIFQVCPYCTHVPT